MFTAGIDVRDQSERLLVVLAHTTDERETIQMTAFAIHSLAISRASDEVRRSNMLSQAIKNAMRTLSIVFTALAAAPAQADLGCNGLGLGNTIDAGGISIPMGATSGQTVLTLPPSTFQAQ